MEKTIYTAKEGERITSVKLFDNSVILTIVSEKKAWENYAKKLGYELDMGLNGFSRDTLFIIALAIMNDLNGEWKPNWEDCKKTKWVVAINEGDLDLDYCYTHQYSLFAFKSKETAQQFKDICGKDFIFKLYGR